jgi:hypothetical protein
MSKLKKETMKGWDPPSSCEELVRGCKAYLKQNGRDVAYKYAIELAKSEDLLDKADGVVLLLYAWNGAYLRPRRIQPAYLFERARMLLDRQKETRDQLHAKNLAELTQGDFELICNMYTTFSQEKAFGPTGTAKLLHVLEPQLFVPWDSTIRKNYHRGHKHASGYNNCYLAFMKQMHVCANCLLSQKSKEDICIECSNIEFITVELPKAIDQYNFAMANNLLPS